MKGVDAPNSKTGRDGTPRPPRRKRLKRKNLNFKTKEAIR